MSKGTRERAENKRLRRIEIVFFWLCIGLVSGCGAIIAPHLMDPARLGRRFVLEIDSLLLSRYDNVSPTGNGLRCLYDCRSRCFSQIVGECGCDTPIQDPYAFITKNDLAVGRPHSMGSDSVMLVENDALGRE